MTEGKPQLLLTSTLENCVLNKNASIWSTRRYWIAPVRNGLLADTIQVLLPKNCPIAFRADKTESISFFQKFEERPNLTRSIRRILINSTACQLCKKKETCELNFEPDY
jgi:hypothetical protein